MRKIKLILLLSVLLFAAGCSEYGEKRIVKLITADREKVAVYYYDYTKEEVSYKKEEKDNNGIKDTLTDILSENNYDLKLCKFAVTDEYTVENEIDTLFFALTNSKFSPDIAIIQGDTKEDPLEYIGLDKNTYPIYSYRTDGTSISGVVEKAASREKNIIINNDLYTVMDENASFILDVMNGSAKRGVYNFRYKENNTSIYLERISVFYSVNSDILHIDISADLKNYKGAAAGEEEKKNVILSAQNHMEKEAEKILQDDNLCDIFGLLWYRNVENFEKIKVNVRLK